jgi:hypothetical protein
MTAIQLQILARYRKHKKCQCLFCQAARDILAERDKKGAKER